MEVELLTENIEKHLPALVRILPTNSQVPILGNILLEANKDGFFLKATDLELGVIIRIPAKINKEGSITVPGKQFIEAISNLPKDKILITEDKEQLKLSIRENKLTFQTLSALEFPELLKNKGEKIISLKKGAFDSLFDHLSFSASTDDIRPHLTGVYVVKKEKSVEMVTTDGYRLTVKAADSESISKIKDPIIISIKVIGEAINIKSENIDMYINLEESQVVFEGGDVVLVGRLIDGKFPPYEKVIPQDSVTKVTLDKEEFIQNIKLASVFAKDQSNIVNVSIDDSGLKLIAKTAGVGEGEFVIDCEKEGEDNNIAFNIRYVLDVLRNFEGDRVTLEINGPLQPALLTDNKKSFRHVIMPVKTD